MKTSLDLTTSPAISRSVSRFVLSLTNGLQAFRETAPANLSLESYWAYPKDMEWVTILAIKFAFIVIFEVF